jgi:hypothetical protein
MTHGLTRLVPSKFFSPTLRNAKSCAGVSNTSVRYCNAELSRVSDDGGAVVLSARSISKLSKLLLKIKLFSRRY